MGNIRKFLVAISAASAVATAALVDAELTTTEAIQIALAFLGAWGVYRVRNVSTSTPDA